MSLLSIPYIKEYNNGQYSLIITSGSMSGVLYAVPAMDITNAVLTGLNQTSFPQEYPAYRI